MSKDTKRIHYKYTNRDKDVDYDKVEYKDMAKERYKSMMKVMEYFPGKLNLF